MTKKIKIATWNVNSLTVRLPHLLTWLETEKPDIVALQETKTQDAKFPHATFADLGYHAVYQGEKSYNGVAIISKITAQEVETEIPQLNDPQKRFLAATFADIRLLNLYVPNGSSVGSDKYEYKLKWLQYLKNYVAEQLKKYAKVILLGDFNIAPEDRDVHDPKAWEGQVLVSEPERQAWRDLLALGLEDVFRAHEPSPGFYSWWDYRMNAYKRNLGLRIDHIIASPPLMASIQKISIDRQVRGWERPSDHVPVTVEIAS